MKIFIKTVIFLLATIPAIIQDCKTLTVPLNKIVAGIFFLILFNYFTQNHKIFFLQTVVTTLGTIFVFILTRELSKKQLGQGDIYLAALCALYCGYPAINLSIIISCFLCFFVAFKNKKSPIPFAPFLAFGAILGKGLSLFIF